MARRHQFKGSRSTDHMIIVFQHLSGLPVFGIHLPVQLQQIVHTLYHHLFHKRQLQFITKYLNNNSKRAIVELKEVDK